MKKLACLALVATLAAGVGAGVVYYPRVKQEAIAQGLQAALEKSEWRLEAGRVDILPAEGKGALEGLKLVRERPGTSLQVEVPSGTLGFDLTRVVETPPQLESVALKGAKVRMVRQGKRTKSPPEPRKRRALVIDAVTLEDLGITIVDTGPEQAGFAPLELKGQLSWVHLKELHLQELMSSILFRARLKGKLIGGSIALEPGSLALVDLDLRTFTPYLAQKVPLTIEAGKARLWLTWQRTKADGPLALQLYLECIGLKLVRRAKEGTGLLEKAKLKALTAYVNHRGSFFAHACRTSVPAAELTEDPGHDGRVIGMALVKALIESIKDDRLDPRRPDPRPFHPRFDTPAELHALLKLEEDRLEEVFHGAIEGRVLRDVQVVVQKVGRAGRILRRLAWVSGVSGELHVKVEGYKRVQRGARITLPHVVVTGVTQTVGGNPQVVLQLVN